jgi:hypothetical protein
VPRQLEFRRNANIINSLQKSGVQVGHELVPDFAAMVDDVQIAPKMVAEAVR